MTAIGMLIAEQMTPAAVELALEIRREIEARYEEADRLRCRAIERAQIGSGSRPAPLHAGRPQQSSRRRHARRRMEREAPRSGQSPRRSRAAPGSRIEIVLDEAVRERLVAMTVDFQKLWADPDTPNRERKRLLAHIIEDVTLIKLPAEGTTKVHVRFKGGKIQTLTTMSPKSSAQQMKTQPGIVELGRQAPRQSHLFRDRRNPQPARISSGRGGAPWPPRRTLHAPCASPISSINTSCARATTDCEIAEC